MKDEQKLGNYHIFRHATPEEDVAGRRIDYCHHGYDVACLICGFGTKDGKRVYHTRPAFLLNYSEFPNSSNAAATPNPYWEIAKQALDDVFQANLMRRLIEDCVGIDMPSRLSANTNTGENYTLPYKTQDEWLQALEKAKLAINPQLDWPEGWPTDANFYRINIDTPIFYRYQHGQLRNAMSWNQPVWLTKTSAIY